MGGKAEYIMKCPYCGNPDTRVIDSRPAEDNNSIRRRRSCDECGKRFTTYEKVETIPLIVIKKDNNREQYDRAKIEQGILSACYNEDRPIYAKGGRADGSYGLHQDPYHLSVRSLCRSVRRLHRRKPLNTVVSGAGRRFCLLFNRQTTSGTATREYKKGQKARG